jgi:hypothetical protein
MADRGRQVRVLMASLGLVAAVALLYGCGSGQDTASKAPAAILAASTAAAQQASSVHIVSADSEGKLSVKSDMLLTRNGGRARLSILGRPDELIRVGETVYVKGNPAFYERLAKRTATRVPQGTQDRWLKASADNRGLAELALFTNMQTQLARLLAN